MELLPLWLLNLLFALLLGGAIEGGYRAGKWRHAHAVDEREQSVAAITGSVLGLLALVLGFTFSFAASRFDARRVAVLQEANAIGTTYLRTRLLPEPVRQESAQALRQYAEVRLAGARSNDIALQIRQSEQLHETLWRQAMLAAEERPTSVMVALYIDSLNRLIDLHEERIQAALRNRIPSVIWIGLLIMALLSLGAVGYLAGLSCTRRSPVMVVLVLAFTITLALIADLDRSQEGLLRVGQQAMLDVQQMMNADVTNTAK
jgi:hypothetical protein